MIAAGDVEYSAAEGEVSGEDQGADEIEGIVGVHGLKGDTWISAANLCALAFSSLLRVRGCVDTITDFLYCFATALSESSKFLKFSSLSMFSSRWDPEPVPS